MCGVHMHDLVRVQVSNSTWLILIILLVKLLVGANLVQLINYNYQ